MKEQKNIEYVLPKPTGFKVICAGCDKDITKNNTCIECEIKTYERIRGRG